eukprot:779609-Amphidinium_carterae.2
MYAAGAKGKTRTGSPGTSQGLLVGGTFAGTPGRKSRHAMPVIQAPGDFNQRDQIPEGCVGDCHLQTPSRLHQDTRRACIGAKGTHSA